MYMYVVCTLYIICLHILFPCLFVCLFRVQFQKRLQAVQEFMKHNKLNGGLIKRVNDFFGVLWTKSK